MTAMGELSRKGLPRPIPSQDLQAMLPASAAFCSWDASASALRDLLTRWPFLFSHPLLATPKTPAE